MPSAYETGDPAHEVLLSVGWGAVSRVELEVATCGDPQCEADHGYTGVSAPDDLSVRMSAAGDGDDTTQRLLDFGTLLQERIR